MQNNIHTTSAQPAKQAAVTHPQSTTTRSDLKDQVAGTSTHIGSVFVLQTEPMAGLWFENKAKKPHNQYQRWRMRDGTICWEPFVPANGDYWGQRIHALAQQANQRRRSGDFRRFSKTSQTRATWSLPVIAACPVRDETCEHCYAIERWYRNDLPRQTDRVLRLEYLQQLIHQDALATWVDWMAAELNALPPDEPWPNGSGRHGFPDAFCRGDRVQYFRWHDSGDLFHAKYALAIFRVCELTPRVAHWLPTRMGGLVKTLVQQEAVIPKNLSIVVSVQCGGRLEQAQIQAVRDVLAAQPSARIGLTYFDTGLARRNVDVRLVEERYGPGAILCPAVTAADPTDRVCNGCRRCWAASTGAPVVYPNCSATS